MAKARKKSWNRPEFAAERAALAARDAARDRSICGIPLEAERQTRLAHMGAHDPTASFYFVLEDLFGQMEFDNDSWLLDVGCGKGRALAYFAGAEIPGRATGIELDPSLFVTCASWVEAYPQIDVACQNALEHPLERYSHFYLFNPFDSRILTQFVARIEEQARRPVTFCHMSDNGEYYLFWGRFGWQLQAEGEFELFKGTPVYDCPQHYSIWRYDPKGF